MSELMLIDGAITAQGPEPLAAAVRPALAERFPPGVNLPLAGAVLLHLGLLALALLGARLDGVPPAPAEVYPIRLYSVTEMAAVRPEASPAAPAPRRAPVVQLARAEARPALLPVPGEGREVASAPPLVAPVALESAPVPVAPPQVAAVAEMAPVGSAAQAGVLPVAGGSGANPAGASGGGAPATSVPMAAPGSSGAAPAAQALVLAHPLYRVNPEPEYPPLARRRGLEGTVVLEALVTPAGTVGGLLVHQSSGHALLDEAALQAVKGWRFEPGRRGAAVAAMSVLVPVRFGLR